MSAVANHRKVSKFNNLYSHWWRVIYDSFDPFPTDGLCRCGYDTWTLQFLNITETATLNAEVVQDGNEDEALYCFASNTEIWYDNYSCVMCDHCNEYYQVPEYEWN